MLPSAFIPSEISELIGPARAVGEVLSAKCDRLKTAASGTLKLLIYGPPGTGKTTLARILSKHLAGDPLAIEESSGLEVNIDLVKRWMSTMGHGSLFGDWQIKLVNELDRTPPAAQDLMLQYLDNLPQKRAFIGTSNMDLASLRDRFQSRLQPYKVLGAASDDLASMIQRFGVPAATSHQIAVGAGGCIRAALLDAESALDVLAAKPTRRAA